MGEGFASKVWGFPFIKFKHFTWYEKKTPHFCLTPLNGLVPWLSQGRLIPCKFIWIIKNHLPVNLQVTQSFQIQVIMLMWQYCTTREDWPAFGYNIPNAYSLLTLVVELQNLQNLMGKLILDWRCMGRVALQINQTMREQRNVSMSLLVDVPVHVLLKMWLYNMG